MNILGSVTLTALEKHAVTVTIGLRPALGYAYYPLEHTFGISLLWVTLIFQNISPVKFAEGAE